MTQHSANRGMENRATAIGERNHRFAALLLAALCLLMTGCNQRKITIFYPCANMGARMQLDIARVRRVFQSATEQVLTDLKKKPAFENLQVSYKVPEAIFTKSIEIKGPNLLKQIAAKEEVDGVMYTIITQPFQIPYCDSAITFYFEKSAVRTHQTHGVLMDYNTFYQIEFWKAELYQMLIKVEGAL